MKKTTPKTWQIKKLGEVILDSKSGFACSKKNEVSSGIVLLRTNHIGLDGNLDLIKLVYLPVELVYNRIYSLHKGDVLFNNTHSVELVGKTAIVKKNLP